MFDDDGDGEFESFHINHVKSEVAKLVQYANGANKDVNTNSSKDKVLNWIESDSNKLVIQTLSDAKIKDFILNPLSVESEDSDVKDVISPQEKKQLWMRKYF